MARGSDRAGGDGGSAVPAVSEAQQYARDYRSILPGNWGSAKGDDGSRRYGGHQGPCRIRIRILDSSRVRAAYGDEVFSGFPCSGEACDAGAGAGIREDRKSAGVDDGDCEVPAWGAGECGRAVRNRQGYKLAGRVRPVLSKARCNIATAWISLTAREMEIS